MGFLTFINNLFKINNNLIKHGDIISLNFNFNYDYDFDNNTKLTHKQLIKFFRTNYFIKYINNSTKNIKSQFLLKIKKKILKGSKSVIHIFLFI